MCSVGQSSMLSLLQINTEMFYTSINAQQIHWITYFQLFVLKEIKIIEISLIFSFTHTFSSYLNVNI